MPACPHLVSCPEHTSHEENGLVNQVEFLGLEATMESVMIA